MSGKTEEVSSKFRDKAEDIISYTRSQDKKGYDELNLHRILCQHIFFMDRVRAIGPVFPPNEVFVTRSLDRDTKEEREHSGQHILAFLLSQCANSRPFDCVMLHRERI